MMRTLMVMRAKLLGTIVALALLINANSVTPAAADLVGWPWPGLFSFQTTFTATPNVVQVGETVVLHLSIQLVPDFAVGAAFNVRVDGMAFPQQLTIADDLSALFCCGGPAHLIRTFNLQLSSGDVGPMAPVEYSFAVSYDTPGVYSPYFRSNGELSVHQSGNFGAIHLGYFVFGSTSVSVVPGPIIGSGLPGLLIIAGFLCCAFHQRRMSCQS